MLSTVSRLADKGFIHRVKLRLDSVSFIKALEKLKYKPKSFTNRILPIQTYHGSKTEQRIESHFITHLFQSSYRLISRHQHLSHIISVCNDGNTRIYINVQTKPLHVHALPKNKNVSDCHSKIMIFKLIDISVKITFWFFPIKM